ncbi:rod shape-determining protein [Candidatus Uhrbacteria bacterium CG22_combo_CG10-13_8_21_14_all_47_17]|uniref:Cell shape-determining protein MreB n=1 Tax=Candidatus Uhrbacteria bacterium CG22_combo_CG10-13_8_21_14_all_47_17 TaxID=1975041 RepID=A0A2H0BS32_9BACT|nr:MAG: rod shape-determining protein [Candidatus Uhrbacteria bacterium CG22_combo_CG10-13_8_21_14_all_47_17]
MWSRFLGHFTKQLGIDLGTANTLMYVKGKGIVVNEPSVVAINRRNDKIIAVGEDALAMVGKTPPHIQVTKPLQRGIIADFEVTEKMLRYFFERVHNDKALAIPRPRVVICVPLDVTEVERKAVGDAATSAGAREVLVVEEPIAAAIGAGIDISEPAGNMIINVGAGSTEIAVISLSGVVTSKSVSIAGEEMNRNIIQYARDVFNLLLGERVAEHIKIEIGSAIELNEKLEANMRGRDLLSGLPREIVVNDAQIREALGRSVKAIVDHVKAILEITPPELVADIYQRGIVLTGGGALLRGLDDALSRGTGLPVRVAEETSSCVVRGTAKLLDDKQLLNDVAIPASDLVKGI